MSIEESFNIKKPYNNDSKVSTTIGLLIDYGDKIRQNQIDKDIEYCNEVQKGCWTILGVKDVECCKIAIREQKEITEADKSLSFQNTAI